MVDINELTKNYFYNKQVIVYQGKKGYRFSVDAPILANFLPDASNKTALEIGCGSGIISLLSTYNSKFKKIYCFEIQKRLFEIASLNVKENNFEKRIEIINADFLKNGENVIKKNNGKFDIVFSNPPFYKLNRGRVSANEETAIAKFELKLSLSELLNKTLSVLNTNADLFLILPYDRFAELESMAKQFGYCLIRKRDIISVKGGKPERFLIQLRNVRCCDNSLINEEPLIIYKDTNIYTEEMNYIFGLTETK